MGCGGKMGRGPVMYSLVGQATHLDFNLKQISFKEE